MTIFEGAEGFYGGGLCVGCNTTESIIMIRYPPTSKTRTVLRTILSAGVLAVLLVLACAGCDVVADGGGGADFASMCSS